MATYGGQVLFFRQRSIKEKVRELQQAWSILRNDPDYQRDPPLDGRSGDCVRRFLRRVEAFIQWVENYRPTLPQQVARVLRRLDPLGMRLPPAIEAMRIGEWRRCRAYFEGVAHHRHQADQADFESWLGVFERFLLDRLRPRTFENHAEIDRIVAEGEADAKS